MLANFLAQRVRILTCSATELFLRTVYQSMSLPCARQLEFEVLRNPALEGLGRAGLLTCATEGTASKLASASDKKSMLRLEQIVFCR